MQLQVVMYSIFYGYGPDQEELAGPKRQAPPNGAYNEGPPLMGGRCEKPRPDRSDPGPGPVWVCFVVATGRLSAQGD
jgi:hypothetical protein